MFPVGLAGRPTHALRSLFWVCVSVRFFLGGIGLTQKVGLCGKVVWRIELMCDDVGVCCWRSLVASGVVETLRTAVVGWVMIVHWHLVISCMQC